MEVMGLMLGEFVDDYTVRVVDVFAMPQSGTGVSVEAVDPVFQTKMLDMLKQVGRYVSQQQARATDTTAGSAGTQTHSSVQQAGYIGACKAAAQQHARQQVTHTSELGVRFACPHAGPAQALQWVQPRSQGTPMQLIQPVKMMMLNCLACVLLQA
jgi:hypothetical protein